jgi:DNA-binding LacI/PurR family transcriptional regulator
LATATTSRRCAAAEARRCGANFVIWGPDVDGTPGRYVRTDNTAGGLQATRHLLRLGRKRIAYLGSSSDHWPEFQARFSGYERALREAGIEPDAHLSVEAQSSEQAGHEAASGLLESGVPFDAIFAASDLIAMGASAHCATVVALCRATWRSLDSTTSRRRRISFRR